MPANELNKQRYINYKYICMHAIYKVAMVNISASMTARWLPTLPPPSDDSSILLATGGASTPSGFALFMNAKASFKQQMRRAALTLNVRKFKQDTIIQTKTERSRVTETAVGREWMPPEGQMTVRLCLCASVSPLSPLSPAERMSINIYHDINEDLTAGT